MQLYLSNVNSTPTASGGCNLSGKLQISLKRIPKATINITGVVDENNKFVGSSPIPLDLDIAGIQFTLAAGFTIDDDKGLVSKGGFLQLPQELGGGKKDFDAGFELVLGPKGLTINGNQSWDLPEIDWGAFQVGNAKATLSSLRSDGNFELEVTGVMSITITGSVQATANTRLRIDHTGIRYGAVDAFTVTGVAGLDLAVTGADLTDDKLIVKQAEFRAPKQWGGAASKVYDLLIKNNGELHVGGVELWLPKLNAGEDNGIQLSSVHGGFRSRKDNQGKFIGYEIWADARLGLPDTSSQENCSIRVKIVLYTGDSGQRVLELASADASGNGLQRTVASELPQAFAPVSAGEADALKGLRLRELTLGWWCQPGIAIGGTGFFISGIQGTILLAGGLEEVELVLWINSGDKVGSTALISMVPKVNIRVKAPTHFKFEGPVYILKYKVSETNILIKQRLFEGSVTNYSPILDYGFSLHASQPKGQRFYMKGSGWAKVQVQKGSVFKECVNLPDPTWDEPFRVRSHCVYFPPTTAKLLGADGYIDNDAIEAAVSYSKYRAGARFVFVSQDLSFFIKGRSVLFTSDQINAVRRARMGDAEAGLVDAATLAVVSFDTQGDAVIALPVAPPTLGSGRTEITTTPSRCNGM